MGRTRTPGRQFSKQTSPSGHNNLLMQPGKARGPGGEQDGGDKQDGGDEQDGDDEQDSRTEAHGSL